MSQRRTDRKTRNLFFQLAIETAANEQGYPTSPVAKRPALIGTMKVGACGRECWCVSSEGGGGPEPELAFFSLFVSFTQSLLQGCLVLVVVVLVLHVKLAQCFTLVSCFTQFARRV